MYYFVDYNIKPGFTHRVIVGGKEFFYNEDKDVWKSYLYGAWNIKLKQ